MAGLSRRRVRRSRGLPVVSRLQPQFGEGAAAPRRPRARRAAPKVWRRAPSRAPSSRELKSCSRPKWWRRAYRRRSEGRSCARPVSPSDLLDGLSFAPELPGVGTRVLARADLTDRWPALAAVSPSRFVRRCRIGLLGCERRRTIGHCGGEPGEGTPSGYSGDHPRTFADNKRIWASSLLRCRTLFGDRAEAFERAGANPTKSARP